jgi:hypothetical protein
MTAANTADGNNALSIVFRAVMVYDITYPLKQPGYLLRAELRDDHAGERAGLTRRNVRVGHSDIAAE